MVFLHHRVAHVLWSGYAPIVPQLIYGVNRILFAVVLPTTVRVGKDVVLGDSGLGTMSHARAVIGDRVIVGPSVNIGGGTPHAEVPVIEDAVEIGAGARVLGPVRVGRGAIVGANVVVVNDVPSGAVAGDVPACPPRSSRPGQ